MIPQPIHTAPKDGRKLLLWGTAQFAGQPSAPKWSIGFFWFDADHPAEPGQWVTDTENYYTDDLFPTHWLPLPEGPSDLDAVGQSDATNGA